MWNHSAVWQVSIVNQVCYIDVSFPSPRVSPFDVESELAKGITLVGRSIV